MRNEHIGVEERERDIAACAVKEVQLAAQNVVDFDRKGMFGRQDSARAKDLAWWVVASSENPMWL